MDIPFNIKDHTFSEELIDFVHRCDRNDSLVLQLASGGYSNNISLNKRDVVALAKHFDLTEDDMK